MKIHNINNYMGYNHSSKSIKNGEAVKSKKYDVIDIKSKTESEAGSDIASVKRNIVSDINKETRTDKLMKIKNSIDNECYSIDVEEIARKMLS